MASFSIVNFRPYPLEVRFISFFLFFLNKVHQLFSEWLQRSGYDGLQCMGAKQPLQVRNAFLFSETFYTYLFSYCLNNWLYKTMSWNFFWLCWINYNLFNDAIVLLLLLVYLCIGLRTLRMEEKRAAMALTQSKAVRWSLWPMKRLCECFLEYIFVYVLCVFIVFVCFVNAMEVLFLGISNLCKYILFNCWTVVRRKSRNDMRTIA